MSFEPAMTLLSEQIVPKNSLGIFWCISPKFLDCTILVVEF